MQRTLAAEADEIHVCFLDSLILLINTVENAYRFVGDLIARLARDHYK